VKGYALCSEDQRSMNCYTENPLLREAYHGHTITTNLPFGEWTNMFPDARLCRAILDRLTHRAHIIETGVDSRRLEDMLNQMARQGTQLATAPN
jgi:hypothetical protein